MTCFIFAISMCVGGFSALVAPGDDFFANTFTEAVIKHKIFPKEFIFKSFFFYRICIMNDASFEMKHIFKTPV